MFCLRPAAAGGLICIALSACQLASQLAPQRGMAERCTDLMISAYPGADIDITKRTASATSLTTIVARVEGDRANLPPHAAIARHLAVECRFDNNILTGFRWTAGPN
jgi:hypothetical protein